MTSLQGKRIVVTGATGGLGRDVCAHLCTQGAEILAPLVESEPPAAQGWTNVSVKTGISLTDEAQTSQYFDSVGNIDGAVLLAGGFTMGAIKETSLTDVASIMELNFYTAFLALRESAKHMPDGGRVVLVSARPTEQAAALMAAYTASKAAVNQLVKAAALELADDNILVNAIMPSIIDTPTNRSAMPDAPFDTWPKPGQIAKTISYLVSDDNQLTSGALIPVYGKA